MRAQLVKSCLAVSESQDLGLLVSGVWLAAKCGGLLGGRRVRNERIRSGYGGEGGPSTLRWLLRRGRGRE